MRPRQGSPRRCRSTKNSPPRISSSGTTERRRRRSRAVDESLGGAREAGAVQAGGDPLSESASARIPHGMPRGERAQRSCLFLFRRGEGSPQLAAESFNLPRGETKKPGGLEKAEFARFLAVCVKQRDRPAYAAVAALWRFSIPRVTKVRMAARTSSAAAMR